MNRLLTVLVTITGVLLAGTGRAELDIVRNGKATAVIVVASDAPSMVRFAATELQAYLKKSTGAELPISEAAPTDETPRVFLGESAETKALGLSTEGLKSDGFKIVAKDNWLALFGAESEPVYVTTHPLSSTQSYHATSGISRFGQTGALYAVYQFLYDQCGVRWYMPGELGEVVSKQTTVHVPDLDLSKEPDFEYRFLYHCDFPKENDAVYWYRRIGFGAATPVRINHSFSYLNNPALWETHPEYYALLPDGTKDFNVTGNPPGNFCLSEPGVLNLFVSHIRAYFDEHPRETIYPVMPGDGYLRICECPTCQSQVNNAWGLNGMYSDYVWTFVNNVAGEIAKTHPEKMIGCCAYNPYRTPPATIEKLNENVAVMICYSRVHGIDRDYKQQVEEWARKAKTLYRWDYYLYGLSDYSIQGLPMFFPDNIVEDLRLLKGKSRGEFIEAESWRARSEDEEKMYYPGMTHLNMYITGKLLWDTETNVPDLLEEYYEKFYGPAREPMKAFWEMAEKLWKAWSVENKPQLFEVYSEDEIDTLLSYLNESVKLTATESSERKRVELLLSELSPVRERVRNARVRTRISADVPYIKTTPVIDGILDDTVWKQAARIDFVTMTGETPAYQTDGWLAWDNENLYLAFRNVNPNPAGIRALATERDGRTEPYIWDDDSMEIIINTQPAQDKQYYHFIVSAAGTLWDGVWGSAEFGPDLYKWNSRFEAKTHIGEKDWSLEIKIPFNDLKIADPNGKMFSVNFYRNRAKTDQVMDYTYWSPTLVYDHHILERFGFITLKKQE